MYAFVFIITNACVPFNKRHYYKIRFILAVMNGV